MLTQAMPTGDTLSFRSTGGARFFQAAFLGVWLTGWAVGEAVALIFIAMIVRSFLTGKAPMSDWFAAGGVPVFVILFVLVWVTFWTIGGIAAATSFLRSVAGEDRVSATPQGVEIVRRAGPFRRRKTFDRSALRRVRLRGRDRTLVADAAAGTQVFTDLGTREEREAALAWLQQHLRLTGEPRVDPSTPPPGWHVSPDPTGALRAVRPTPGVRRKQALVMWFITAIVSLGWISPMVNGQPGIATLVTLALWLAFSLALAAGAAWLTWGRSEWIVRTGALLFRRQFGQWIREDLFEPGQLVVEHSTDSDGDDQYRLFVRGSGERDRTIFSAFHDDAEVTDAARWLKSATGFPLSLPR